MDWNVDWGKRETKNPQICQWNWGQVWTMLILLRLDFLIFHNTLFHPAQQLISCLFFLKEVSSFLKWCISSQEKLLMPATLTRTLCIWHQHSVDTRHRKKWKLHMCGTIATRHVDIQRHTEKTHRRACIHYIVNKDEEALSEMYFILYFNSED